MGHTYQHEDEMETEYMEQIKILCAERDELVAALRVLAPLVDNWVNGDGNDEMCAWAEALSAINAALAKLTS